MPGDRTDERIDAGRTTEAPSTTSVDTVSVLGAGTMGYGIALAYAAGGCEVRLFDVSEDALERARRNVHSGAATLADAGRLREAPVDAVVDRIAYYDTVPRAVETADFVTEAVPEDLPLKRDTFEQLDAHAPEKAILASNTSGLSITEIAAAVEDPSRVVGTHWFNPAHIVPGVEVIYGTETADRTVERTTELLETIGKTPVVVERDIPGFIGNRIQLAMAYEAFSLLESGVASAEAIDRAVKSTFGFRLPAMGVFEKADQSGLDVHYEVESYLMAELDRGSDPHELLADLVEEGKLGVKSGEGIYDWSERSMEAIYEERDRQLVSLLDAYEAE